MAEITVAQLATDLRLIGAPTEDVLPADTEILGRLLPMAKQIVDDRTDDVPEALRNAAISVIVAYMYDKPSTSQHSRFANVWVNSGASSILSNYVVRPTAELGGGTASPTPGGGETLPSGVDLPAIPSDAEAAAGAATTVRSWSARLIRVAINAVVPPWARIGDATAIPAEKLVNAPSGGGQGGAGVDQTARDAAAAAKRAADAAAAAAAANDADIAANKRASDANETAIESNKALIQANARDIATLSTSGTTIDSQARAAAANNAVEIGRNSRAVTLARDAAEAADRKAVAAQEAVPEKATDATIDGESDNDDFVTTRGVFRAIARKFTAAAITRMLEALRGDARLSALALKDITSVLPGGFRGLVNSIDPAVIEQQIAGEKSGDIVIGYTRTMVGVFRYVAAPTNAWRLEASWRRGELQGRTDTELEQFIETIVEAWSVRGSADKIPGAKTFDGLFKSEAQSAIPAANVAIPFDVGTADDKNEVDETDAAATTFLISPQQAEEAGGFVRVRYDLKRTAAQGQLPRDIELLLQTSAGVTITKHNLKDEGAGTAQFAFGDAGAKRWAIRCVTTGRYAGTVTITEATFHSSEPLADAPIEHVVHPIVSDEAEKRQAEDARLTAEIARVEEIKAIVNGLPKPAQSVKKAIVWRRDRPYQQADSDAFQVPDTGYVAFVVGNFGTTAIMPVELCKSREEIVYSNGNISVGLQFSPTGQAALYARDSAARWASHEDAYNTTNGFVMLTWAPARAGGTPTPAPASSVPVLLGTIDGGSSGSTRDFSKADGDKIIAAVRDANTRGLMIVWKFSDAGAGPDSSQAYMPLPPDRPAVSAAARRLYVAVVAQNGEVVDMALAVGSGGVRSVGVQVHTGHSLEVWKVT